MTATLLRHLWRSPVVRRALWRDSWSYFLAFLILVGVRLATANSQDTPILSGDRLADMALVAGIWLLMWLLSVIRTVRKVLRAEQQLAR